METETNGQGEAGSEEDELWDLRIYVLDGSPRAQLALGNLRRLAEEHRPGHFHIEVIDLEKDPGAALRDCILAVPTVVRRHPLPVRTLVATLTDLARTRSHLDPDDRPAGEKQSAAAAEGDEASHGDRRDEARGTRRKRRCRW